MTVCMDIAIFRTSFVMTTNLLRDVMLHFIPCDHLFLTIMGMEHLLRDVKRAPIDGFPTSTAMIQQETETILLEHGINGGV